ncbi:MAG: hypothetical protein ACOCQL_04970 [Halolamina sp.]
MPRRVGGTTSRVVAGVLVAYGLFVGLSVPQQPNTANALLVAAGSVVLLSAGYLLYCEQQWGWYASVLVLGVGVVETLLGIPESGTDAAVGAAVGVFALLIVYSERGRFGVGSSTPET